MTGWWVALIATGIAAGLWLRLDTARRQAKDLAVELVLTAAGRDEALKAKRAAEEVAEDNHRGCDYLSALLDGATPREASRIADGRQMVRRMDREIKHDIKQQKTGNAS